jgi:hypothetical protein
MRSCFDKVESGHGTKQRGNPGIAGFRRMIFYGLVVTILVKARRLRTMRDDGPKLYVRFCVDIRR